MKNEQIIKEVTNIVCDYYSLLEDEIKEKTRKREIVQARQIAMKLSYELCKNAPLSYIGKKLGGKDHATVLYAIRTVSNLIESDREYRKEYEAILKKVEAITKDEPEQKEMTIEEFLKELKDRDIIFDFQYRNAVNYLYSLQSKKVS